MTTVTNLLLLLQDRTILLLWQTCYFSYKERAILLLWQTCCYSWWPVLRPVSCTATWFAGSTWRPGWPAGSWWWPRGRRPPPCGDTSGPRTSSESAGLGCSPSKALSANKDIPTSLTCFWLKGLINVIYVLKNCFKTQAHKRGLKTSFTFTYLMIYMHVILIIYLW